MLKKEEAIEIVKNKFPDRDVDKVTETTNYFLVSIIPKRTNPDAIPMRFLLDDGLLAVDKNTKKVFTYNPLRHGE